MLELVEYIKKNKLGEVYLNKTFKDLTTLKIGGKIRLLYYPNTVESFILFYKKNIFKKKYPIIIIGNGSNTLASSDEYDGIVICFKKVIFKYCLYNNKVIVTSGVMINDLINYLKNNNLGGLELLSYIPATIGGMVKMNASAYGSSISDNLIYIKCLDKEGNLKVYQKKDLIFDYRNSNINDEIILECCFSLINKSQEEINNIMKRINKERKSKQPLSSFNAGSTFKNGINYVAWELIDSLNFRGFSINEAMVSNKHCNFLINKNNATSDDMIKLINVIKREVYNKYGIKIECEWKFINFKKSISFL